MCFVRLGGQETLENKFHCQQRTLDWLAKTPTLFKIVKPYVSRSRIGSPSVMIVFYATCTWRLSLKAEISLRTISINYLILYCQSQRRYKIFYFQILHRFSVLLDFLAQFWSFLLVIVIVISDYFHKKEEIICT